MGDQAGPEAQTSVHAIEARHLAKTYGGQVALADGMLELARGEVHVLMGSNGSGKSTLCKIIAGAVRADSGTVTLHGEPTRFRSPHDARAAGIATVYQETSLIPTLTVAQNIVLGAERVGRRDATVRRVIDQTGTLAAGIDPDALVGDLSIDRRQIVEVLKALVRSPRVILFDEATASLDRAQVTAFFALVRVLRDRGCAIIFISHRLEEIFAIGDRVTIMRNGRHVVTRALAGLERDEIVQLMTGGAFAHGAHRPANDPGAVLLDVRDLRSGRVAASLTLRRGEVLGLGGLHGQGQSELLQGIFAIRPIDSGSLTLAGVPARIASPLAALRTGIAYVSGDRGRVGALGQRPIFENLVLSLLARERNVAVIRGRLARRLAPTVERLRVRMAGLGQALSALSGGNQQKVILGRALAAAPRVLLLDDPTKGIDVEAKRDLYALIDALCREGAGVILYSSEDAELLAAADRVLVFNGGRVVDELAGADLTEFALYSAALREAA